jgi:O-antigen/teichoic acid export membrane protein
MSAPEKTLDALSTEHLKADLKGRSVRGGVLTLASQGSQFVLSTAFTVVLARLLTPADFGLVAMVTAITALGQAFADLGLSEATIQQPDLTHDQVSALFWINLAIGVGLNVITIGLAPVLARFYREPRLFAITLVLSVVFTIGGLRVQPDALLKRQMRFKALAIRDVVGNALGVLVSIIMAVSGAGYWAIVALPLTTNFAIMALSWVMVRWRPSLPRRGVKVRSLLAFGGNVAASYLVDNFNRNASNIVIGWYWGAAPLGLFSRAYNLLTKPVSHLTVPAAGVAIPAFSRLHDDTERFAHYYVRTISLIMWVGAPLFGFLFVAARPVIILVLGRKWLDAAPVFEFLAISSLAQPIFQSGSWVLLSTGRSDRLLRLSLMTSPIIVGSFLVGLPFGIKGVALSYSIAFVVALPWILKFVFRGTSLTIGRVGRAVACPVVLCCAGVVFSEIILRVCQPSGLAAQFLLIGLGFALTYLIAALIPSVRQQALSFSGVVKELGLFRQAVPGV